MNWERKEHIFIVYVPNTKKHMFMCLYHETTIHSYVYLFNKHYCFFLQATLLGENVTKNEMNLAPVMLVHNMRITSSRPVWDIDRVQG